jgi:hypothetical protein
MSLHVSSAKHQRLRGRRLRLILKAARTLDVILSHVCNGGSLISLCDTWNVRYSDVVAWIRADKAREAAYDQAMRDRSEWTDEMILSEVRAACRFDIRRLYFPKGHLRAGHLIPIEELDAETARMIREVDEDGKVKVYDRLKALELAGKNRKLYTDNVNHSGEVKLEDVLARSYEDPPPASPAASPEAAGPLA